MGACLVIVHLCLSVHLSVCMSVNTKEINKLFCLHSPTSMCASNSPDKAFFSDGKSIFFLFLHENIGYGYSLETHHEVWIFKSGSYLHSHTCPTSPLFASPHPRSLPTKLACHHDKKVFEIRYKCLLPYMQPPPPPPPPDITTVHSSAP